MFMKLKPRDGLKIRHPQTLQRIPPEGETVEIDTYWIRLLASGDVVEVVDSPQIPDSEG